MGGQIMALNSDLVSWVKELDVAKEDELRGRLMELGVYELDHFREFNIETDLHDFPFKVLEKRRFITKFKELQQNDYRLVRHQKSTPLNSNVDCNVHGVRDISSQVQLAVLEAGTGGTATTNAPCLPAAAAVSTYGSNACRIRVAVPADILELPSFRNPGTTEVAFPTTPEGIVKKTKKTKAEYMKTYRAKLKNDPSRTHVLANIRKGNKKRQQMKRDLTITEKRTCHLVSHDPNNRESSTTIHATTEPIYHNTAASGLPEQRNTSPNLQAVDLCQTKIALSIKEKNKKLAKETSDEEMAMSICGRSLTQYRRTFSLHKADEESPILYNGEINYGIQDTPNYQNGCEDTDCIPVCQLSPSPQAVNTWCSNPEHTANDSYEKCAIGVKKMWSVECAETLSGFHVTRDGSIICCTEKNIHLLSKEGYCRNMFDTNVGVPADVSVNRWTGEIAFLRHEPDALIIYSCDWNHHITVTLTCRESHSLVWADQNSVVFAGKVKKGLTSEVYIYTPSTEKEKCIRVPDRVNDITVSSDRLIFCSCSCKILVYDLCGRYVHSFPMDKYLERVRHQKMNITADNDGRIVLVSPSTDSSYDKIVTLWTTGGHYIAELVELGSRSNGHRGSSTCLVCLYKNERLIVGFQNSITVYNVEDVLSDDISKLGEILRCDILQHTTPQTNI